MVAVTLGGSGAGLPGMTEAMTALPLAIGLLAVVAMHGPRGPGSDGVG